MKNSVSGLIAAGIDPAALLELELQLLLEVALDRLADHQPLVLLGLAAGAEALTDLAAVAELDEAGLPS